MSRVEESSSNPLSVWRITYETANQRTRSSELVAFNNLLEAMDYAQNRAKDLDLDLRAVDQMSVPSEDQKAEKLVKKIQSQKR